MSKRPTDHLIPPAKKRSGDRQISREEPPGDSEDEEPVLEGEFRRADDSTLKARRIFKARRGAGGVPASAPPPAAAAAGGAAGSTLTPANSGASNPSNPASNPFAGISLVPSSQPVKGQPDLAQAAARAPPKEAELEAGEPEQSSAAPDLAAAVPPEGNIKTGGVGAAAAASGQQGEAETAGGNAAGEATATADEEQPKQAESAALGSSAAAGASPPKTGETGSSASSPSAFASFASTKGSGFAGLGAGAGNAANGLTFGGGGVGAIGNGSSLGRLGSSGFASSFGGASAAAASAAAPASTAFSFNTGGAASTFSFPAAPPAVPSTFPSVHNIFGGAPLSTSSVFGSGGEASRPVLLPAAEPEGTRVTGEEEERTVFAGDGVLFEFTEARQWAERGRGEMRVKVANKSGQARLVMRSKGQLRLLMNANLWPEIKVTPMDGGKGVTFACINAAALPGEDAAAKPADTAEDEEKGGQQAAGNAAGGKLGTFAFRVKVPGKLEEFKGAIEAHRVPAGPEDNV